MPLIDSFTNLKSNKFGKDRFGGGSSNQPYVQTGIPNNKIKSSPDFILRGGTLKAQRDDLERITKFFSDIKSPNGILFVTKQQILSKTSPKTETSGKHFNEGIYNPLSTLLQIGVLPEGVHIPKQSFIKKYYDVVNNSQDFKNNRLYKLTKNKDKVNLMSYDGGPGSILGVGTTNIKFADQRTGGNNKYGKLIISNFYQNGYKNSDTDKSDLKSLNIREVKGVSFIYNQQFYKNEIFPRFDNQGNKLWNVSVDRSPFKPNLDKTTQQNTYTLDYDQINSAADLNVGRSTPTFTPKIQDFRQKLRNKPQSPDYRSQNIENRLNLGDPGNKWGKKQQKNLISYSSGTGNGALDKVNELGLYQSSQPKDKNTNDAIKFRIQTINYNGSKPTYIHFRAFINNISDSITANWDAFKYNGRADNFYNYKGFDRGISLSWNIMAQSREELIPMYKKLNYLISNMAPDYSGGGFLKGPLIKLTIGDYLYETPGFITSMNLDISEDTTWEIGIDDNGDVAGDIKQLPHMIRVSNFQFTPIHNFIIGKQSLTTDKNGFVKSYGREQFINV